MNINIKSLTKLMRRRSRQQTICMCETKGADSCALLKRTADQSHCFRNTDSTIPPIFKVSILILCLHKPVCVGFDRKPKLLAFSCVSFVIHYCINTTENHVVHCRPHFSTVLRCAHAHFQSNFNMPYLLERKYFYVFIIHFYSSFD